MKTKKLFLATFAAMCALAMTTVFTACGSDDDDSAKTYSYGIFLENEIYSWQDGKPTVSEWIASITGAYKTALGVTSDTFTKTGKEAECNKQVYDACKKAESTVATIKGGSATVMVINSTTGKTVYTYKVQP
jgi:hypothetical protein